MIDEGDPFNEILANKTVNEIKALNFFSKVDSDIISGKDEKSKIINITVNEKPTGEISIGAGVGSEGGSVGFAVSENNFLGKGIKLATSLSVTDDSIRGEFTIQNPNFNYSMFSMV